MEERDRKSELLVGLFLFIGLLLMAYLILQFGSVREVFKPTYPLTVELVDGTGIKESTPVMLGGSRVGKVTQKPVLNAAQNGVVISLKVYQETKIASDAKFSIGTSGLLGDSYIEIKPSGKPPTGYIEPGAHIKGEVSAGLAGLQNSAEQIANKVDVALEDIRGAVADLRLSLKHVNEGALSEQGMKDVKESFAKYNSVITRLDEKTLNDQTSKDVTDAVHSFKEAAKTLEESMKKLQPAFTKLEGVVTKIDGVVTKADTVMGSADGAMKSIDASADAIGKVANDLRRGEGLLPALINDSALKTDFKNLVGNLRQRGVLFYKDKPSEAAPAPSRAAPSSSSNRNSSPPAPRPNPPLGGRGR
ncbi:MAG TPA: MlaD family protein [Verrucomicrobium sp.]|nr:MlaD family protein [Verrucomicrobium sp.]